MNFKKLLLLLLRVLAFLVLGCGAVVSDDIGFSLHGFRSANMSLGGVASLTPKGLLQLNNFSNGPVKSSHSFYPNPIKFKKIPNNNASSSVFSFSTNFIFAIVSQYPRVGGHGLTLVISPTNRLPQGAEPGYLGLFNDTNHGNSSNHIFAVELDTIMNNVFKDINGNHVGIDINGVVSVVSRSAGYYSSNGAFQNLTLMSGQPMQLWVEYDAVEKLVNVTLAPLNVGGSNNNNNNNKPNIPLLSLRQDLSEILEENMYVGFSSCTGSAPTAHYILGWSFKINGVAQRLDFSRLPKLPRFGPKKDVRTDFLKIGLPIICTLALVMAAAAVAYYFAREKKFAEEFEEWELAYGTTHRFKYKDLYAATKGFKEKQLLGSGGFGRVYKGILPTLKTDVAVKKVSHESKQGIKEFVAEIVSMGRLRHRNLVPLLGYCRRKGELLLVYEYMPNGSLDKFLHDNQNPRNFVLNWGQRFKIIQGVASGLLYLHEEWEQRVIHRDVKASNVLLDGELNGRLGDFGLARLYDHGSAPQSTHVVGTLGYLAPEHNVTGKATTSTDVYAFGAFLLEVACGRRPIEPRATSEEETILIHWVFSHWQKGNIVGAIDPKILDSRDFVKYEVELVLKLGLLCSHSEPVVRPSMRQVVMYLEGSIAMPELSTTSFGICAVGLSFAPPAGFDDLSSSSFLSSKKNEDSLKTSFVADSLLSGGR